MSQVRVRVVTRATRLGPAAAMLATAPAAVRATTARAAMLGLPARILVGLVLTRLAALGPRHVRPFLDLELRRRRELDGALEQLLDVLEQRCLVR